MSEPSWCYCHATEKDVRCMFIIYANKTSSIDFPIQMDADV